MEVTLPDHLVERRRSQPSSQRRATSQPSVGRCAEQIPGHRSDPTGLPLVLTRTTPACGRAQTRPAPADGTVWFPTSSSSSSGCGLRHAVFVLVRRLATTGTFRADGGADKERAEAERHAAANRHAEFEAQLAASSQMGPPLVRTTSCPPQRGPAPLPRRWTNPYACRPGADSDRAAEPAPSVLRNDDGNRRRCRNITCGRAWTTRLRAQPGR